MAGLPAILIVAAVAGLMGCASTKSTPARVAAPPTRVHNQTVYYEEGHIDTEQCCAPLNEWMPKLFGNATPSANTNAISLTP
jgi:hypothetical protein